MLMIKKVFVSNNNVGLFGYFFTWKPIRFLIEKTLDERRAMDKFELLIFWTT